MKILYPWLIEGRVLIVIMCFFLLEYMGGSHSSISYAARHPNSKHKFPTLGFLQVISGAIQTKHAIQ